MRRRIREGAPSDIPLRHLRYVESEWADARLFVACGHPECAYWAGMDRWKEQHSAADWPSVIAEGPDTPFHPENV